MGGSGDGGHVYAVTLTAKSPLFCNTGRERSGGERERERASEHARYRERECGISWRNGVHEGCQLQSTTTHKII
jgi:hypothetical protein